MKTNFKDTPGKERCAAMNEFIREFARSASEAKNSKELIEFLTFAAQFHNYSLNNTILIWCQNPEATYVRGFRQWQDMGRYVKKGAKAIFILIPTPKKIKEIDENGEEVETLIRRFKWGSVFDISDTEGEELPNLSYRLDTDNHEDMLDKLKEFAQAEGYEVILQDYILGGAKGQTDGKIIEIDNSRPIDSQVFTMAHELAHDHLHFTDTREARGVLELEAETVAVTFAQVNGIENGGSEKYVARWTQGIDTEKEILARLDRIRETVQWLFSGICEQEGAKAA